MPTYMHFDGLKAPINPTNPEAANDCDSARMAYEAGEITHVEYFKRLILRSFQYNFLSLKTITKNIFEVGLICTSYT